MTGPMRHAPTPRVAADPGRGAGPGRILLVEDIPSLRQLYEAILQSGGHAVESVGSAAAARESIRRRTPLLTLLDLSLPDARGLGLLREMIAAMPAVPVLVITAETSARVSVEALRAGAQDFLVKPFDDMRLLDAIEAALGGRQAEAKPQRTPMRLPELIAASPAMQPLLDALPMLGRAQQPVLITGESGTGKTLIAATIHARSGDGQPMIAIDCADPDALEILAAALPSDPAPADGPPRTLLLENLDEALPALQTRLLQISAGEPFPGAPYGGGAPFRIIATAGPALRAALDDGRLREDLYYRLNVLPLSLPPLRERGEDILAIAEACLARALRERGRGPRRISAEAREVFLRYPWPGNLRELVALVLRSATFHDAPELGLQHLPEAMVSPPAPPVPPAPEPPPLEAAVAALVGLPMTEIERRVIEATIAHANGSVTRAARILDVAPSTLYRKIEAWSRPEKPQAAAAD
ncbi:sigma-54-dependent transcriptional regulator [Frigidibacter sp. MR17.24]|uniref:sigma-54-dependent transcriptional regulator n=1 Tax=Frigidibacter sp. MR17.24 TaxID=3127345 RepID=UPI003012ADD1